MKSILSLFLFFIVSNLYAQPLAGDECNNATPISVGAACISASFTTVGATNSGLPTPACASMTNDVWFQTVVPSSGFLQIKIQNITAMTTNMSIYTGSCGNLTEIQCQSNLNIFNLNDPSKGGLTIYIRVWRSFSSAGGIFNICAWETSPPINDFCNNATELVPGTSCAFTQYNNLGCTGENNSVAPNPSCGSFQGGDSWFKVLVPASGHLRIEKSNGSGVNQFSAIYSGTCGSFTQLICQTGNQSYNINQISLAGQYIYIRVWDHQTPNGGGNFNLCVWEPPTPTNDLCAQAVLLTVGTNCNFTTYTNVGSTAEPLSISPNPTCGIYQGGDIWFKVIMPSSGHLRIEKENVSGISAQSAVYTGTCGAMTQLACLGSNQPYNINNILLAGQTLYIRVWDFNNAFGGGSFKLCAWETNPPINDFCSDAISLTVGTSCNFTTYNNIGCTAEATSISPNPSCGIYQGTDVWFKVVVPSSGHLRIEKNNVSSGISYSSSIYSGSCGSMTELACIGSNGSYNFHNHAMAGSTLYIRVWDFNAAFGGGMFNLCAWEPNIPENDFCSDAITLQVDSICVIDTFSLLGCTAEPTSIVANPSCGFYEGGDLWFKFTMPISGHCRLKLGNLSPTNAKFALYQGACGNFTEYQCVLTQNALSIHDHALAGATFYIRIWNFSNAFNGGNFEICVTEPNTGENDFCANAIPIPVGLGCIPITYSSLGCTSEPIIIAANPSCGFYEGGDIWYTFLMPTSGLINIEKSSISPMNAQLTLYTGTCGAFTQIGCSQLQNSFTLNNLSLAGQTIYLRVFNYGNADGGVFNMCLYDPTCLVDITDITTSPSSCSLVSDGSLTVTASCAQCVGNIEYSINNGPYQSNPIFSNINSGFYTVRARDSGNPQCIDQWSTGVIVGATLQSMTYFQDLDGDNYGNTFVQVTTCGSPPANYVTNSGDCNDANPLIHPGAIEISCNGIDENCNGLTDDTPGEINIKGNCASIFDGDLSAFIDGPDATYFGKVKLLESKSHLFTIENSEPYSITVNAININGTNASMFSINGFSPNTIIPSFQSISFNLIFTPSSLGLKNATITVVNSDCNEGNYDFAIQGEGVNSSFSELNLKFFIEGYYTGIGFMTPVLLNQGLNYCNTITDSIEVELRDSVNYSLISSTKTLLHTDGSASCKFPNINGRYYLVVKHRNALLTWSSSTLLINSVPAFYDFTLSNTKAYGNNQVEIDTGLWGFYSGDINQDENIDLLDIGLVENDINNFEFGYRDADLNGDGNVDLLDSPILEGNVNNFIYAIHP